jgi:hypothetical protein
MGVNFIQKYKILGISKNSNFCSEINFEIENVENLHRKFWVEKLNGLG